MTPRPRPGHRYLAGAPLFFAHRGGARLAPENTLEAFLSAVEVWGADVLEMDVHGTRDGDLVVIHDPTVDRTTDGAGFVRDLTLDQVRGLDAGYRFVDLDGAHSFRGRGIRIPRFEDVLHALPGVRLNVDAKEYSVQRALVDLIHAEGQEHRVLLASAEENGRAGLFGYRGPVSATRRQLRLFYALHDLPGGRLYTPRTDALQAPLHWRGRAIVTRRFIEEAHRRNIPVHAWVIDDPDDMRRLLEWGVDGIQTDRLDLLARVLHEETGRPLPPGLLGQTGHSSKVDGGPPEPRGGP